MGLPHLDTEPHYFTSVLTAINCTAVFQMLDEGMHEYEIRVSDLGWRVIVTDDSGDECGYLAV